MRGTRTERGLTVADVLAVLLAVALMGALALSGCFSGFTGARKAALRMECSSQMRQIGLAVFQYEKQYGCMPNAQWNAFRECGGWAGLSPKDPNAIADAKMTEIFRCPSDEYLPQAEIANGLSYAPIVDSAYLQGGSAPLVDQGDGNLAYCAWSYCKTGYQSGVPDAAGNKVWQLRNLSQCEPDTALMIEKWDPANRLNIQQETPAGYLLKDYSGDAGNDPTKTAMGTLNFGGPACAATLKAVSDVGGYVFLSAFAADAAKRGRGQGLSDLVHDGVINVLEADGAVLAKPLKDITNKSPKDIAMWTRTAD